MKRISILLLLIGLTAFAGWSQSGQQMLITTASLPTGTVGTPYSFQLTATGGKPPYSWQVAQGALPAGLTLNDSTGLISGTPTAAGAAALVFLVRDSSQPAQSATKALGIQIGVRTLFITTTSLPSGTVGTPYSQTLTASGGTVPYTWSLVSGNLPAGLTLIASTGQITGTPLTSGQFPLNFQVRDSGSSQSIETATAAFTLTIGSQLVILTQSLTNAIVGSPYSQLLTATGGTTPYVWQLAQGALPLGLALNTATGQIGGTPTVAGQYPLFFRVTDSSSPPQIATVGLALTVAPPTLLILTPTLRDGQVNSPYSQALAAVGGTLPLTWQLTAGALPPGLTLAPATGVISGTPTVAANATALTFRVTDAAGQTATATFFLRIAPLSLSISTTSLPDGRVNSAYSQTLAAAGGIPPYTWALTSGTLPAGLTFNAATGLISGTPSAAVSAAALTFKVTDSSAQAETASATLRLTVAGLLTITTPLPSLPDGVVGAAYSQSLAAAGGTAPYVWQLAQGVLPAGLTLNASTGEIGGRPSAPVNATPLTLRVTDSGAPAQTASATFTLTVLQSLISLVSLSPATITATAPSFVLTINGTGFAGGATVQVGSTTPQPSSVSATRIAVLVPAGAIAQAGSIAVTVTNQSGGTSNALTLTVNPAPAITIISPTSAVPGASGFTLTVTGVSLPTGAVVSWNGQSLATTYISATQLTATVPASLIAAAGRASISIVTVDGAISNASSFTVAFPPLPAVSVTAPSTVTSAVDQPVAVTVGGTYPVDLNGTLTLTFNGDAGLPDDPAIQFSNLRRVFTFTVPAGTQPVAQQISVKSGTLAGVIVITPTFSANGTDVTPPGVNPQRIQVARAAPSVSLVTCTRNSTGFTLVVAGYTNTREATQATFDFTAASGASLGTNELVVNSASLFSGWFGGTGSASAGGLFGYTQPFNVQGSPTAIASATVKLANSIGTSATASCQLQ